MHTKLFFFLMCRTWRSDPSNSQKFPLYISIDSLSEANVAVAVSYQQAVAGLQVIQHVQQRGTLADHCHTGYRLRPDQGYCYIALHYKSILELFFNCLGAPALLLVEEDLQVAPDFFAYFEATRPLLDRDRSLWCVSAWNDHGQEGRARDQRALMRTDVMPGLGEVVLSNIIQVNKLEKGCQWGQLHLLHNGRLGLPHECVFKTAQNTSKLMLSSPRLP
jgi:alpha-1,3-mannosyl-glycoprotein beta-1,2-N-acetylglucosaminyltransferase